MRFEFVSVPEWPSLAWLSRCQRGSSTIVVAHGSGVETREGWFGEAAWAGDYEEGAFDQTDIVAGTGGRIDRGEAIFVSPGSTVDRLQVLDNGAGGVLISNSLACLLSVAGADLDPSFPQYFRHFRTVVRGIRQYARLLPTSRGPVQLVYFDNVVWNGETLTVRDKPDRGRDFSSFARLRSFLDRSMAALAANLADGRRARPYSLLSTASSGYDSSTATVLGYLAGCRDVLCVDHDRTGDDDSGEPLARHLSMNVVTVKRDSWREQPWPEVPFVAADAHGGDVFFKGAERTLDRRVLLTGFHGDKMWDKQAHDLSPEIVRGDQSGLSLTEYRLHAGFLHCPVPFWGVRRIRDVHAISQSPEMAPWDVPGDYSRPVCRRIVEEAGVPREMFGTRKKATWVQFMHSDEFMCGSSLMNYLQWLREKRGVWLRRGRVPPVLNLDLDRLELKGRYLFDVDPHTIRRVSLVTRVRAAIAEHPTRLRRHVFPWAVERMAASYPHPL
jgi:hypothetical protein